MTSTASTRTCHFLEVLDVLNERLVADPIARMNGDRLRASLSREPTHHLPEEPELTLARGKP